ncbi:M48 family metallopeptidase [Candidatus Peregrinibacteria bacterium]|nr:M48 family metallopeptidase [Candidatus Peregrinibacteria bacterium]
MPSKTFRHRIERTRNKHSRALYQGNTIIIRLAKNLSRTEEHEHIEDLLRRMREYLKEEAHRKAIDPFRPLLEGGRTLTVRLATGKSYHFVLFPAPRTRIQRHWERFRVSIGPNLRRLSLHRLLWKALAHAEAPRITGLVARLNHETFRARIRPVNLRFAKSQWGSCSPRGVIMINTALLFVLPSILKYVIIHELAHTIRRDHSPTYWREVQSVMPRFQEAKNALEDYRLPIL